MSDDLAAAYRLLHERATGEPLAEGVRSLSTAQYDAARRAYLDEQGIVVRPGVAVWPPTSQTVMKRLGDGSWARAMESLGLTTNAGRARGAGRFGGDDYRSAIREFLSAAAEDGDGSVTGTSFVAYSAWAKTGGARGGDAPGGARPSGAAVRQHFGSWEAAKGAAAERE